MGRETTRRPSLRGRGRRCDDDELCGRDVGRASLAFFVCVVYHQPSGGFQSHRSEVSFARRRA